MHLVRFGGGGINVGGIDLPLHDHPDRRNIAWTFYSYYVIPGQARKGQMLFAYQG